MGADFSSIDSSISLQFVNKICMLSAKMSIFLHASLASNELLVHIFNGIKMIGLFWISVAQGLGRCEGISSKFSSCLMLKFSA